GLLPSEAQPLRNRRRYALRRRRAVRSSPARALRRRGGHCLPSLHPPQFVPKRGVLILQIENDSDASEIRARVNQLPHTPQTSNILATEPPRPALTAHRRHEAASLVLPQRLHPDTGQLRNMRNREQAPTRRRRHDPPVGQVASWHDADSRTLVDCVIWLSHDVHHSICASSLSSIGGFAND